MTERKLTDRERWKAAQRWCDTMSGRYRWRILSMDSQGFRYVGERFTKARWKSWTEPEARAWVLRTEIPRKGGS